MYLYNIVVVLFYFICCTHIYESVDIYFGRVGVFLMGVIY